MTKKQKVAQDIEEKYLNGITQARKYDEEGEYSLFAVRTHYGRYCEALNDMGLPSAKDIPGLYSELTEIKEKRGKVNQEIYDEEGFFRSEAIEPVLEMDWEEIDDLL